MYKFIVLIGTGIILIAFFFAITYIKKRKPDYFKYIFLYLLSGLLISANTIMANTSAWILKNTKSILIEQVLILLQSLLLGKFCLGVLKESVYAKKIKWLIYLMILTQIIFIIIVHTENIEIRPSISSNLILLIFCSYYFRNLMTNEPTLILVKSSAFWIFMGIFFSSCIGFPVGTLTQFIPKYGEYGHVRSQIFSIFNVSLIFLYLFIIKSYICLKHPQNL